MKSSFLKMLFFQNNIAQQRHLQLLNVKYKCLMTCLFFLDELGKYTFRHAYCGFETMREMHIMLWSGTVGFRKFGVATMVRYCYMILEFIGLGLGLVSLLWFTLCPVKSHNIWTF